MDWPSETGQFRRLRRLDLGLVHVVERCIGCSSSPKSGVSKNIKANRLCASKIIGDITILLDTRKARSWWRGHVGTSRHGCARGLALELAAPIINEVGHHASYEYEYKPFTTEVQCCDIQRASLGAVCYTTS